MLVTLGQQDMQEVRHAAGGVQEGVIGMCLAEDRCTYHMHIV